jgi:hypothetical protein
MAGAVVFLVSSCVFVLPDDVALVVLHGKTAGKTNLGMARQAQPVDVQSRNVLHHERRGVFQLLEVAGGSRVHFVCKETRSLGQIDFRTRHMEEAQGIPRCQGARLGRVDNVVGHRCNVRGCRGCGTKRSKRSQCGHAD